MIRTGFQKAKSRFSGSHVAKGASFALTVRVYGAALAYLTQLYLARAMGAEQLGIYVFAWTWLSLIAYLAPLGFDISVVRFLASYVSNKEWGKAHGIIRLAYTSALLASVSVAILGLVFIWVTDDLTQPYTQALGIAFATIPLVALVILQEGIARGFNWIYQVSMPNFVLRPTLFLLLVLTIAAFGYPVHSTWTIGAMSCACLLTWIYQYWRYRQSISPEIVNATRIKNTRNWLAVSLPMVFVVSFEQLLANTDIVMLGMLDSPEATGIYNIAVRIVGIALFVFFAVSVFAAPRIAALYSQNKVPELIKFSSNVRLAIALPTILGLVILILIGVPLLAMFGSEFTRAYNAMTLLCVGVAARALAGPVDNLLIMTGQQNKLARVLGTVAMFNIVSNALLIPAYGMIGAACATTASMLIEVIWVSSLAGRHIGFYPWLLTPKV